MLNRTQMDPSGESGRNDLSGAPSEDSPQLLVIDDDTVHRMIICRMAAKIGYVPIEAPSYEEAEKQLRAHAFACISLDLSLGRRGGVDVLHLLAELDCKTPIVIISGTDADVRTEAMDVAAHLALNAYEPLAKPVNLADLRRTLTSIKLRTTAGLIASSV